MEITGEQRLAICRVLLDITGEEERLRTLSDSRHYQALCKAAQLSELDWTEAARKGVLDSLVILKDLHFRTRMMIGMVVYDLFSLENSVSYQQRASFGLLMEAMDWPVSFSEIAKLP